MQAAVPIAPSAGTAATEPIAPMQLLRTDSTHPDFRQLVAQLDAYLSVRNGDSDSFYAQFNTLDKLRQAVIAYQDGLPVGCGAFRPLTDTSAEIKRMYVVPADRGRGIAGRILAELEAWSRELGFTTCLLETGRDFTDAVQLYRRHGYVDTPNYGPYVGVANSLCMRKDLTDPTGHQTA